MTDTATVIAELKAAKDRVDQWVDGDYGNDGQRIAEEKDRTIRGAILDATVGLKFRDDAIRRLENELAEALGFLPEPWRQHWERTRRLQVSPEGENNDER